MTYFDNPLSINDVALIAGKDLSVTYSSWEFKRPELAFQIYDSSFDETNYLMKFLMNYFQDMSLKIYDELLQKQASCEKTWSEYYVDHLLSQKLTYVTLKDFYQIMVKNNLIDSSKIDCLQQIGKYTKQDVLSDISSLNFITTNKDTFEFDREEAKIAIRNMQAEFILTGKNKKPVN